MTHGKHTLRLVDRTAIAEFQWITLLIHCADRKNRGKGAWNMHAFTWTESFTSAVASRCYNQDSLV
jgi:hypothetical protein